MLRNRKQFLALLVAPVLLLLFRICVLCVLRNVGIVVSCNQLIPSLDYPFGFVFAWLFDGV